MLTDGRHYTSAINGRKSTGNPNPNYSGLLNQPGQPRGKHSRNVIAFLEYALSQGAIVSLSSTPVLDYCRSVALNEDLRHEIRLGASAIVIRYEKPPPGVVPFLPPVPEGYSLPPLTDTRACQLALAQLAADSVSGKIRLDAAKLLREHIAVLLPSLETSEVKAEIEALRSFIDGGEQARTIEHQAGSREPDTTPQDPTTGATPPAASFGS
jgi:hypothetical protein